nr:S24 family peptidase [Gluconobacter kanchanaburiensis]
MNYQGDRTTGFASPAGDNIEGTIDLMSAALDLRQPSRYPVRVEGDALLGRSIQHGDILVVDSAVAPRAGVVVVAATVPVVSPLYNPTGGNRTSDQSYERSVGDNFCLRLISII